MPHDEIKVFVYGSLKRGYWNSYILENSEFIGEAEIKGYDLFDVGSFPAIVEQIPFEDRFELKRVQGEIYLVDPDTVERLDRLEGVLPGNNGMYLRKMATAIDEDRKSHLVYVYVWNQSTDRLTLIEGESWPAK